MVDGLAQKNEKMKKQKNEKMVFFAAVTKFSFACRVALAVDLETGRN